MRSGLDVFTLLARQIKKLTTQKTSSGVANSGVAISTASEDQINNILATLQSHKETIDGMLASMKNKNQIISGGQVLAKDPPSTKVRVLPVEALCPGTGIIYSMTTEQELDILYTGTPVSKPGTAFVLLKQDGSIELAVGQDPNKVTLAKIIVPNSATAKIRDDKSDGYDAYIVPRKDLFFEEDFVLDDESIAELKNIMNELLADNLVGTITLSEGLKIQNTDGSLTMDSQTMKLLYPSGNSAMTLDRNGIKFYNDNKQLLAYFTKDEARVASLKVLSTGIESTNFVSGASGFQIKTNGDAEFFNGVFRGTITGVAGYIGSIIIDSDGIKSQNWDSLGVGFKLWASGKLELGTKDGTCQYISYNENGVLSILSSDAIRTLSDFSSLQDAIDSLPSIGGEIYVPPGTYSISSPISVNKMNITISGAGPSSKFVVVPTRLYGSICVDSTGCVLRNFSIQDSGEYTEASALIQVKANSATISDVTFQGCQNGIFVGSCFVGSYGANFIVSDTAIRGCTFDGACTAGMDMGASTRYVIDGCLVKNMMFGGGYGIYTSAYGSYGVVTNNRIYDVLYGVDVNGTFNRIMSNVISNTSIGTSGIVIAGNADDSLISSNTVSNFTNGIWLNGKKCVVSSNVIDSCTNSLYFYGNSKSTVVTGNMLDSIVGFDTPLPIDIVFDSNYGYDGIKGWGSVEGDDTEALSVAITFPLSYTNKPCVFVSSIGEYDGSTNNIGAFARSANVIGIESNDITTSGFNIGMRTVAGDSFVSGTYYGYEWIVKQN